MSQICVRAWVAGKVQGVYYRACTQDMARQLRLTGYARNLPDGRVEVLACGEEQAVQRLLDWLWQGSPRSKVSSVESEPCEWQNVEGFRTE